MTAGEGLLRRLAKRHLRDRAIRFGRLRYRLPSGIEVTVADHSDWVVYNDLFVLGEYDAPIEHLLASPAGGPLRVLDLGANVGYFILRLAHLLRRRGEPLARLELTAVEGHPRVFGELRARLARHAELAARCHLVGGLVGERAGEGRIEDPGFSAMARVTPRGGGVAAPYVDLDLLPIAGGRIGLLKCDIEGSEERFLRAYPDLLDKVDSAIFELHRDLCDAGACHAALAAAGLTRWSTLREEGSLAVRWYLRP